MPWGSDEDDGVTVPYGTNQPAISAKGSPYCVYLGLRRDRRGAQGGFQGRCVSLGRADPGRHI